MKKRSPIHAYKRLLARDQDWDFAFLGKDETFRRMHFAIKTLG